MNRTRTGISFALAFVTLSGAALAADAPAAPSAATATAAAPAAAVAPPAASPAVTKSTSSTSSSDKGDAGVRQMFCLNMSMQCFAVHQAAASSTTSTAPTLRRLDLNAPDIRRIVPEANLREPIQDEYEMLQETEQVQVEGTRPEIYVPGGLVSLPWAVMHPTQAWRIFLPVNSAK